jgi:hypothetical protein
MMRDCQIYSRKVAPSKTRINCSNHGIFLKRSVMTLYYSENELFQTMLEFPMFYWYQIYYISLLYFEIGALTSQIYASTHVLQMNKDIQKVWRYAALQWHNITTKHPEYQ